MSIPMFKPLTPAEIGTAEPHGAANHPKKPVVPVPIDAPQMEFRHPEHGEPWKAWPYHDADGQLVGYMCRWNFTRQDGEPDKTFLPVTYCELGDGKRAWRSAGFPEPRPLYGLPNLLARPDATVLVTEGEKASDAAAILFPDTVATTPPNGARSPHKADWRPVEGKCVVVWPDHDQASVPFAKVAAQLARDAGATEVRVVQVPPDFRHKWDLADPMPDGWDASRLRQLLDSAALQTGMPKVASARRPYLFRLQENGVHKRIEDDDGNVEWRWFCSLLEVAADTRDTGSENWGRLLVVTDRDGREHEWAMPMAMMAGDGAAYRELLLSMGMEIAPGKFAKDALHEYIATTRPDASVRCVSRIGWHDSAFVLPDTTFGDTGSERVLLQTAAAHDHAFRVAGDLADWRENVSRCCVGNSRLMLAVSAAFAPPLLYLVGEESGGIHFVGQSRTGKTTTLRAAGSVWGGGGINGFLRTWRATSNGLETVAAAHCDALLCLDEMGQVDAREAGEVAYMLANGSGKSRARRDGTGRPPAQWRLLFLSTGELGLAEKMNEGGKKSRAGQEVRLADVPADTEAGLGIFESIHDSESADAFARRLQDATGRFYGTAARAYLERLTQLEPDELGRCVALARTEFISAYVPENADGQVSSVAGRFALIAAAGELATHFGITGWPVKGACGAAAVCLKAWLERRGGADAAEIRAGFAQIRKFFEAQGTARFEPMGLDADNEVRIPNRAGFRRRDDENRWEYFVLPETFRTELCAGADSRLMSRELRQRGFLIPDQGDGKPQSRHRLPGLGTKRVYHFAPAILEGRNV